MDLDDDDRRRFPRVALKADVRVCIPSAERVFDTYVRDLSETGVFIFTADTRPIGTGLQLELVVREGHLVIKVEGIIVHEVPPTRATDEQPAGIGVMFLNVDAGSKALLKRLLERGAAERNKVEDASESS